VADAAGIVLGVLPGIVGSESGNWLMRFTPTAYPPAALGAALCVLRRRDA